MPRGSYVTFHVAAFDQDNLSVSQFCSAETPQYCLADTVRFDWTSSAFPGVVEAGSAIESTISVFFDTVGYYSVTCTVSDLATSTPPGEPQGFYDDPGSPTHVFTVEVVEFTQHCGPPWAGECPSDDGLCPIDSPANPGGSCGDGSSAGEPVNVATGEEVYTPKPDIVAYNPAGQAAAFQRTYFGRAANQTYGSPGLPNGWVHNYDYTLLHNCSPWNLMLVSPERAAVVLTAQMEGPEPTGAFNYRWNDPTTARWLTRDPIGYGGGANLYGYVGGNPVGVLDPWGLVQVLYRRDKHKLMAYDHDGKLVFGPYDWGDKGNAPAGCYNLGRVDWLRDGNRVTRSGSQILHNQNHPRGTGRTRAQSMGDVAIFVLDVPDFPGLRIHYSPNPARTEGCLASDNQDRVNELARLLEDEDQGWNQLTIVDKEPWDPILRGKR